MIKKNTIDSVAEFLKGAAALWHEWNVSREMKNKRVNTYKPYRNRYKKSYK